MPKTVWVLEGRTATGHALAGALQGRNADLANPDRTDRHLS